MIEKKKQIDAIVKKYSLKKGVLIPLLQEVQELFGFLPQDVMGYVAEQTRIRAAEIFGVATFYSMFRLVPQGEHIIRVCKGTACHVSNANGIENAVRDELKLVGEQDTTEDGKFTVLPVACLGCCSLAPVIMIDDDTHGKLTPDTTRELIRRY
ncbi:MAG: NADH-quinone oxidoreductase subunit NuoE [Candidatus Cloacimonadota bacterium]|nr:NADH-quinone oxidoreductase subunit NuoE [Candidatus Cloacimonadota bacterium]